MSDSNEQFVEWLEQNIVARSLINDQLLRQAWEASRQALVVRLPAKISHLPHSQVGNGFVLPDAEQYDEAIDDCREAIEAAGVRVKE